jgi:hypothetical protein
VSPGRQTTYSEGGECQSRFQDLEIPMNMSDACGCWTIDFAVPVSGKRAGETCVLRPDGSNLVKVNNAARVYRVFGDANTPG